MAIPSASSGQALAMTAPGQDARATRRADGFFRRRLLSSQQPDTGYEGAPRSSRIGVEVRRIDIGINKGIIAVFGDVVDACSQRPLETNDSEPSLQADVE